MHRKPEESATASPRETVRELKRQLEESRRSESRLRAYLELASQGLVAVNSRGRIVMVNVKTEEMFGYQREEMVGQPLELLLPARYRRAHAGHRKEYFARPRTRPMGLGMELSGVRKDGTEFPVEVSLSWVPEDGDRVAFGFITDISERKRLEEQLRQTQKLESLGVLAGGVAHDFNNLLTGLLGNASLALDSMGPSHHARRFLDQIVVTSHRAADLTRQLLAYAGKGRFVITRIDISQLVREIASLIESSIPKTVQLRLELAENPPLIEGDASQIQQLAMNLIINAGEAIGEEGTGTVLVTTGLQEVDSHYLATVLPEAPIQPGRFVCLEVSDTGQGMSQATIARIFDPFFTTKFTGRGLGLAAVSGIVRGHRGTIKVYSESGKGSTFKVLLPAVETAGRERKRASETDLAGVGLVLVVDDEAVVRQIARAALERYGYTVAVVADGQSAVEFFERAGDQVAVVLLDMTMPGLAGPETLQRLQAIRPGVRVVLSSGYNESEAIRRFTGRKLAGFLQKPYTAAQLAEKIQTAVREGRKGSGA